MLSSRFPHSSLARHSLPLRLPPLLPLLPRSAMHALPLRPPNGTAFRVVYRGVTASAMNDAVLTGVQFYFTGKCTGTRVATVGPPNSSLRPSSSGAWCMHARCHHRTHARRLSAPTRAPPAPLHSLSARKTWAVGAKCVAGMLQKLCTGGHERQLTMTEEVRPADGRRDARGGGGDENSLEKRKRKKERRGTWGREECSQ